MAETVADTLEQILEMDNELLNRIKAIRTKDESITICEGQNIKQEAFLTQIRMDIMPILLSLVEEGADSPETLQKVGKDLLNVRTKTNGEITQMIMLRTNKLSRLSTGGDCDCGVLGEVV